MGTGRNASAMKATTVPAQLTLRVVYISDTNRGRTRAFSAGLTTERMIDSLTPNRDRTTVLPASAEAE